MNLDNEYNIAARYRSIRKHLDSLGYRQALSLDALPLIEKLLSDLIQTTDSLKHFKAVAHDNVEACSRLQLSIDPYKCDNARLVQECNQLHLDLIEAKETHQTQVKDLKKKIYTLESECSDLQAASSRNLKRIKESETESAQKSKRIQELLGKCNKPLINNVALGSKKRPCYPLRRPSLEAEPLPRSKSIASLPSHSKVEPRVVDLIAMADRKISALSHEVTGLKGELSVHMDSVYSLKNQLATKEKEISRLRLMLEGGRPYSAVSKDCSCKKKGQCCDHGDYENTSDTHSQRIKAVDDDEMRILEKSKSDVEQQLREALKKQHEAMSQAMKLAERNEELEKELRDIDHIALAVEADCNSVVKENNKRVSQLQEKLSSVMTQVHVLEGELMVERRSGQELRADLEGARLESRNLQRKLESSLDEKKRMNDRINQLTVMEQSLTEKMEITARTNRNLKQEIARLERTNNLLKKRITSTEIVQNFNEDIEKMEEKGDKNDRNKGKMLMKKKTVSRGQRRSLSPPIHDKQTETTRRYSNVRDDEVTRDSNVDATKNAQRKFNSEQDDKCGQQTIDQLQTDRDFYKKEYNRLREQSMKNSETNSAELWGQVCELRRQLIDKEHAVLDLQKLNKELCREKFELELRLQSARCERRKPGNACGQCRPMGNCVCSVPGPLAGGDSKTSSALMERLERERDLARADVDRLVEERDTLRERLKLAVETHKHEQRRLKDELRDVETRLKNVERQRQDLLIAQGMQRATNDGFNDQLEDLREELRRTKQDLSTQRTQYLQLRTLQDQADQALGDVQGQLNHSETELYKAMERNRLLEQQRSQLDDQVKELKQEINNLRANRNQVDEEKDRLMMDLEDKTGRIASLEREIKAKEDEIMLADQRLQELHHKNELCVDQSAEQERRLRNMQMEMEIHQRQLAAASNDRDNAAQENRRLQDDLAAVTCEIRTLQRELEVSRAESYDLKRQLQTYVTEVRRAEDLINKKENERTEMLNHFRSLSLEATMLENNNHSLESEAAEARGALQASQDRTMDLERQLADRDCLIRGYETQISELTQTVASLETQIRQQIDQRQRTEADLNAVRDLCVKLDQQKEQLVKELGDKEAMKAQYEAQISRLKTDQNMVQDQINRDHVTVERLESLLDQARQESMDSQTAKQELQCEMSRLKQRTCELQNKLSAESDELRRYQNQAVEYSKQIAELRRQVTNERFARARKEEEHRRYPQCGKSDEPRNRGGLRFEAQRTNIFNATSTCKATAITTCEFSTKSDPKTHEDASKVERRFEANSRDIASTLNPHVNAITTTSSITKASITDKSVQQNLAHRATSKCGGLSVRATVEDNGKHKDIRVRISDASVFKKFHENHENNFGIVESCKSAICKQAREIIASVNDDSLAKGHSDDSDFQIVEKSVGNVETSGEEKSSPYSSQIDDTTMKMENNNETPLATSLSSKINRAVRNLNCTSSKKLRTDRREIVKHEDEDLKLKRKNFVNDDDTSGYHTSESPEFRNSNDFHKIYNNEGEIDDRKTNDDTLRVLERLLDDRHENDEIRSKSVPRGRTNVVEKIHLLRSNVSGPIRVDHDQTDRKPRELTRPEVLRWLEDIEKKTRNVERQLARMNSTLTSTRVIDDASTSNEIQTSRDNNLEKITKKEPGTWTSKNKNDASTNKIPKPTKKTKKDGSSQSDFFDFLKIITSTPKSRNKIQERPEKMKIDEKMINDEKSSVKGKKRANGERREFEGREFLGNSDESLGHRRTRDSSSRRIFHVDESTMFKPSKIHKLRSAGSPKRSSRENSFINRSISPPFVDDDRSTIGRADVTDRSFIPTRRSSPDRIKCKITSKLSPIRGSSLIDDPEFTSTMNFDDSVNYDKTHGERRPSFVSPNRQMKRSPIGQDRSRSVNSNETSSFRDNKSFGNKIDGSNNLIGRSDRRSRVSETQRSPREARNAFAGKTIGKGSSSRDRSVENATVDSLSRDKRTNVTQVGHLGRSVRSKSASPRGRRLLVDGRVDEGYSDNDERGATSTRSQSPGHRSRKIDDEKLVAPGNYQSYNSSLSRTEFVKRADSGRKNGDDRYFDQDDYARSNIRRRSQSDPRESRNNSARRGYR